jgi:beta-lactamase regulating signal transducer with metallopeptidase domain
MALPDIVAPESAAGLAALIGSALLKSTIVLVAGSAAVVVARGASAAARHLMWTLTLGGAFMVPLVAAVVPAWHVPLIRWSVPMFSPSASIAAPTAVAAATTNVVLARAVKPAASAEPVRQASSSPPVPVIVAPPAAVAPAPEPRAIPVTSMVAAAASAPPSVIAPADSPAPEFWLRVLPWVPVVWLVGAIVVLIPVIIGLVRLASLRKLAHPVRGGRWALLIPAALREIGVQRRVRFLELEGAAMPMTWGVLRPVVLLPAGDFDSTIAQRLDVLRHELAHVRRYDCLTQLVAQIACAGLWFNPLAWIAARQLRAERERACDDEVLRAGAKPSDYAGYLLRVARSMHVPRAAAFGGLAMARPSQLAGRLLAVLDDGRPRARMSWRAASRSIIGAAIAVTVIASLAPEAANANPAFDEPTAITDVQPAAVAAAPAEVAVIADAISPASVAASADVVAEPLLVSTPQVTRLATTGALIAAPSIGGSLQPAALPAAQGALVACDKGSRSGKRSSSTNISTSRDGSKQWKVIWRDGDCSFELDARGEIKFNRDVTDIESVSQGGSFTIEEDDGDDTRRLVVRPRSDGALERQYSVNGDRREFDAAARAWLAEALVALDRQTAFAVDQRVPAILERGGVNAVMQEISLLGSDYAKRRYYTKLLSTRELDRGQVRRVVEQAGVEIESDYELAELLVALSKLDTFGDDSHVAFVSATKTIRSDYERRRALNALLRRDQLAPATVEALLDAASTIGSDYELAELLIDVSKRYAINEQTRPTYIKAVGSIKSDYEHRRVLSTIVASGGLSSDVTRALLENARRIGSDYELAEFLVQVAKKGTLDATTRDAYFAAADKIKSDYEHHRALTPLVKRDVLTKDLARSVLASAAKIDSDYEAATLLVSIANVITIDDDLRPAFERAADTIQGEYEYGRAMSALRRRVTR